MIIICFFAINYRRHNYGLLSLLTLCIMMSFSKGTYLAYIVFLICLCLTKSLNTSRVVITVLATICVFYFYMSEEIKCLINNAYTYTNSDSYNWRTNNYSYDKDTFSLLFGSGITSSSMYLETYESNTFTITAPNIFLKVFLDLGIIGCGLFLWMILSAFLQYRKSTDKGFLISYLFFILVKESSQGIMMSYFYIFFIFCLTLTFLKTYKEQPLFQPIGNMISHLSICIIIIGLFSLMLCKFAKSKTDSTFFWNNYMYDLGFNNLDKYPIIKGVIKGEISTSDIICDSTLLRNPYICVYRGVELYNDNSFSKAIEFISYSVLNQPSFIHSSLLNNILKNDSIFADSLRVDLIQKGLPIDNNPKTMAKYGYILKYYNIPEADYWLYTAVNKMPSLSIPWLLLGNSSKFKFLTSVGDDPHAINAINLFNEFDLVDKLQNEYLYRFMYWYGYAPYEI
ncbi:O-antigen ligase [uncultured Duncaniella sp.]|nr:O-antigen ligase family protein [uncultured Duncaniella sp.]